MGQDRHHRRGYRGTSGEGLTDHPSADPAIPFRVSDSNRIAALRADMKMLKWLNGVEVSVLIAGLGVLTFLFMR